MQWKDGVGAVSENHICCPVLEWDEGSGDVLGRYLEIHIEESDVRTV